MFLSLLASLNDPQMLLRSVFFFCFYVKVLLDNNNPTLLQCGNVHSNDRHLLKFTLRRQYYVVIQSISAE